MNERTFKWELTQGLVLELVSLDKEARRDFFKNLPKKFDGYKLVQLSDFHCGIQKILINI